MMCICFGEIMREIMIPVISMYIIELSDWFNMLDRKEKHSQYKYSNLSLFFCIQAYSSQV